MQVGSSPGTQGSRCSSCLRESPGEAARACSRRSLGRVTDRHVLTLHGVSPTDDLLLTSEDLGPPVRQTWCLGAGCEEGAGVTRICNSQDLDRVRREGRHTRQIWEPVERAWPRRIRDRVTCWALTQENMAVASTALQPVVPRGSSQNSSISIPVTVLGPESAALGSGSSSRCFKQLFG